MAPTLDNKVYEDLIKVTTPYLGPSSERFIDRQIKNHLNKEPQEVKSSDLVRLIDWIRLSMSILTEDNRTVNEYINKIKLLYKA